VIEGSPVDEASLRAAIRRATLTGRFVPLLCGSALRNRGVPQVLDAICDYLPSPLDVAPPAATGPGGGPEEHLVPSDDGPLLAVAFKVSLLDEKRRHVFVRVYCGRIAEGDAIWNANLGVEEKASRVLLMHAVEKKRVPTLGAGQIFAVVGLKTTRTGDTLSRRDHPLVVARIAAAEPVLSQAFEAASLRDRDLLLEALARVADEDPSLRFGESGETGELVVSGMGELHLEIVAERIRREFGLAVRTGQPQVLLRETIGAEADGEATFERVVEEKPIFGQVAVHVAPLPRGAGHRFEILADAFAPGRESVRAFIAEGAREAMEAGVLEGHPLQDVQVQVTRVAWRDGESQPFAYKIATADAVEAATARARPLRLEPLMRLEIVAPGEYLGEVIGSVDRRGGVVVNVADRGAAVKVVEAEAPLRRMFGYATELRSATQGRSVFTMAFDRFDAA
jgi:elongation factor G